MSSKSNPYKATRQDRGKAQAKQKELALQLEADRREAGMEVDDDDDDDEYGDGGFDDEALGAIDLDV